MKKKKNIAIIITRLDLGGAQKIALYLAEKLDKQKFNVHLIAGKGGYLDKYAMQLTKKGVKVNLWTEIKHPINIFFDVIAVYKLRDYFIKNNIDIVHTHSSKAGILGRKAAFIARIKKVMHTIHGFPFHEHQNPFIHSVYVLIEKIFAGMTNKLIAVGYDVMEYGLNKGVGSRDKYVVIRPGINVNSFKNTKVDRKKYLKKYGLNQDLFTVGMVGNLKKQKNPYGFVKIAKAVIDETKDVQFVFAGDGKNADKINKMLDKYKISDKVKFIGWIDEPEKFFKSIDLFLLTSLWEGLPCTLVQAVCAGNCCVATDVGGNREFMKDIGLRQYLFEPEDYETAKELIIKIKKYGQKKPDTKKIYEYDLKYVLKEHKKIYLNDVNQIH
ncbi:MAG: glycosyltransferase [Candidatus Goldbacteria bacterium]|nr:glycosyltransferase [Candidatus Goldiibacteriota bacterium]